MAFCYRRSDWRCVGTGCGEMSELATRARELFDSISDGFAFVGGDVCKLIEQALLAERALARRDAMEEAAKIAESWAEFDDSGDRQRMLLCEQLTDHIAKELRNAATPRGGE